MGPGALFRPLRYPKKIPGGFTNEQSPQGLGLLAGICWTKSKSPLFPMALGGGGGGGLQMTSALDIHDCGSHFDCILCLQIIWIN